MTQLIVFNGPKGSGKDLAATILQQYLGSDNVNLCSFKKTLVEMALKLSGLSQYQWDAIYTRELKDQADWRLRVQDIAVSPRRYLIWISEEVIKPIFGKLFFGEQAVKQIDVDKINAFSDSGFKEELWAVIDGVSDEWNYNAVEVVVVRLFREDCTYENDSRSYLQPEDFEGYNVRFVDVVNDTIEQFAKDITLIAQTL